MLLLLPLAVLTLLSINVAVKGASVTEKKLGTAIARQQLERIASSKTLAELRVRYSLADHDFPARAIYATKLGEFGGVNADEVLLQNLPKDGTEMEELYNVQGENDAYPEITACFYKYYQSIAEAVVRHPMYMPQFLRVVSEFASTPVDNADERPLLCEAAHYVYKHRPAEYMDAVKKLEMRYRAAPLSCRSGSDIP